MPYLHKKKWGGVESLGKRSLLVDPHLYSAPVGTVRVPTRLMHSGFGPDEAGPVVFWRSKTRTSSFAEWMELHDAADGATLWRAESRYSDRAAPVDTVDPKTGEVLTEYLTVVRMYLESETRPRLMIVHRDQKPAGLRSETASRQLSVYTLDMEGAGAKDRASASRGRFPGSAPHNPSASTNPDDLADDLEEPADQFEFAPLPDGGDIFQISCNNLLTNIALTAVSLTGASAGPGGDVRVLARMKRPSETEQRWVDIDGGLDVPLVTMLLCAVDQLLISHAVIDYDVAWPSDYAFANGECCLSRKPEAVRLNDLSDNGIQTEGDEPRPTDRPSRMCLGLF
jgi:hypothetical protein